MGEGESLRVSPASSEKWEVLIPESLEHVASTPYSAWPPISKPVPALFPASELLKALSLGARLMVPFPLQTSAGRFPQWRKSRKKL